MGGAITLGPLVPDGPIKRLRIPYGMWVNCEFLV